VIVESIGQKAIQIRLSFLPSKDVETIKGMEEVANIWVCIDRFDLMAWDQSDKWKFRASYYNDIRIREGTIVKRLVF
jgi:hypothetical protein